MNNAFHLIDALRSQKAKTETNLAKLKTAFVKVRNELNETRDELERKTTECIGVNDKLQLLTSQIDSLKVFVYLYFPFEMHNLDGIIVIGRHRTTTH